MYKYGFTAPLESRLSLWSLIYKTHADNTCAEKKSEQLTLNHKSFEFVGWKMVPEKSLNSPSLR